MVVAMVVALVAALVALAETSKCQAVVEEVMPITIHCYRKAFR